MNLLNIQNDGISFNIHVQPRASRNEFKGIHGNALKLLITAPPVEGEANNACIEYISKVLKTSKSNIKIISGEKNRLKVIKVSGNPKELFEIFTKILDK